MFVNGLVGTTSLQNAHGDMNDMTGLSMAMKPSDGGRLGKLELKR